MEKRRKLQKAFEWSRNPETAIDGSITAAEKILVELRLRLLRALSDVDAGVEAKRYICWQDVHCRLLPRRFRSD